MELDRIHSKIKSEECNVNSFIDVVTNVVNVYNDNAQKINELNANRVHYEDRTYEDFCKGKYTKPTLAEYEHEESLRQFALLTKIDEESQVTQVGYLFRALSEKITHTILCLSSFAEKTSSRQVPEFTLVKVVNKYDNDLFAPRLRKITTRSVETPTLQRPIIEVISNSKAVLNTEEILQKVEPLTCTPVETISPKQVEEITTPAITPTIPKVDVTVLHNLTPGQTLGICCDPTWDKLPIRFTKGENGWTGQIPVNQDWKFVTLQNGQVTGWEKGKNRRCNEQTQAFTVKANEVRF